MIVRFKLVVCMIVLTLSSMTNAKAIEPEWAQYFLNYPSQDPAIDYPIGPNGDQIFIKVQGTVLKIHFTGWDHLLVKEVYDQRDYDGDGKNDAIIIAESGGPCCGSELFLVSHRGDRFFSVHSFGSNLGNVDIKFRLLGNKIYIDLWHDDSMLIGGSAQQTISTYIFENALLVNVNNLQNRAYQNYAAKIDHHSVNKEITSIDLDGDTIPDELKCGPGKPDGFLNCDITLSKFGLFKLPSFCKNAYILHSISMGVTDLGCNQQVTGKFDGQRFSWSE